MDKEIILSILGLLTTAAAFVRWLLQVNRDQKKEIEDLRNRNEKRMYLNIKEVIQDLKAEVTTHKEAMRKMQERIDYIYRRLDRSSEDLDHILKTLHRTIDEMNVKVKKMETEIVRLSKGLVLIRQKTGTGDGQ